MLSTFLCSVASFAACVYNWMEKYAATYYKIIIRISASLLLSVLYRFYRTHVVASKRRESSENLWPPLPSFGIVSRNVLCSLSFSPIHPFIPSRGFYLNFKFAKSDIKMKYLQISALSSSLLSVCQECKWRAYLSTCRGNVKITSLSHI